LENFREIITKELICSDNENYFETLSRLILEKKEKQYSHKINNRWENQYIDVVDIPEIKKILNHACYEGKKMIKRSLVIPYKELGFSRNEFWFNIAKPGDSTGWHNHKEKAVLSGVYYLQIPKGSGEIVFRKKRNNIWSEWSIKPNVGKLILFDSFLEHSVKINKSDKIRISIAFNLYTLPIMLSAGIEKYSSDKFYT